MPHRQCDGTSSVEGPSFQVWLSLCQDDNSHGAYLAYDNSGVFKCQGLKHPAFVAAGHQGDHGCTPIPIHACLTFPRFLEQFPELPTSFLFYLLVCPSPKIVVWTAPLPLQSTRLLWFPKKPHPTIQRLYSQCIWCQPSPQNQPREITVAKGKCKFQGLFTKWENPGCTHLDCVENLSYV